MSVKTKLISEEAVLTTKNKKAKELKQAITEKDDEIALKLQETKIAADKLVKETKDKALLLTKGKGGKGNSRGKGSTKGKHSWNDPDLHWN